MSIIRKSSTKSTSKKTRKNQIEKTPQTEVTTSEQAREVEAAEVEITEVEDTGEVQAFAVPGPTDPPAMTEALRLAAMDYRVFPCKPRDKAPATPHGLHDATTDPAQIRAWWTQSPDANIGLNTERMVVVDCDPRKDKTISPTADNLSVFAGAISKTPREGGHFYFRAPPSSDIRNSTSKLEDNVDVRANGGYVLLPPSYVKIPEDGIDGCYSWVRQLDKPLDQLPLPPDWLIERLNEVGSNRAGDGMFSAPAKSSTASATLQQDQAGLSITAQPGPSVVPSIEDDPSIIPKGQRNETLFRLACYMRRAGMGESSIRAALYAENIARCRPLMEQKEIEKIAWSVCRYEPDQITQAVIEGWAEQDAEIAVKEEEYGQEANQDERDPGAFPSELLDLPGMMGEVVAFNLQTAYRPQPILALGGAVALMSILTAHKIRDSNDTRTNVYVIGIGPSGCGKEHAQQINTDILSYFNGGRHLGPTHLVSSAGILSRMDAEPITLMQLDEIGFLVESIRNGKGQKHLTDIPPLLMQLYSKARSQYTGTAYADRQKVPVLLYPHLTIFGATTPKRFWNGLTPDQLIDGFLSRILLFETPDRVRLQEPGITEVPESILEKVRSWEAFTPNKDTSANMPLMARCFDPRTAPGARPAIISHSSSAFKLAREYTEQFEDSVAASDISVLWTRAPEKVNKLALLRACSRTLPENSPQISAEDIEWAAKLVTYLTQYMIFQAGKFVSENAFESNVKRSVNLVVNGMTKRDLIRKMTWVDYKEAKSLVDHLLSVGKIRIEKVVDTGGRPSEIVRLPKKTFGRRDQ